MLTEVFIGVGLLWRRTRLAAVWVAIPFHLAIEATAAVQVFSWAALVALVVWVTPTARDRTVMIRPGTARLVRALDWTGRFRIEQSSGQVTVIDRDGTVRRGAVATRFIASRLPLGFPLAAPLTLLGAGRTAYSGAKPEEGER